MLHECCLCQQLTSAQGVWNHAGPGDAQAEQKPSGCICAESGILCGCAMNGLHSRENGEGGHPATWSPFADMDQGPGLHDSVCSCQRCKLEDGGDLDGSSGRPTVKGMQTSATPGPALVLHSDADRREFISAGAAGGLAVCLELVEQAWKVQSMLYVEVEFDRQWHAEGHSYKSYQTCQ